MSIFFQLFRRDLIAFKREFLSKLFDTAFLLFTQLVVFGYFFPAAGVGKSFGAFMLVSAMTSFGFFDLVGKISTLIADIEGEKTISYSLTLPASSSSIFLHIAGCWAMRAAMISFFILPLGKIILLDHFSISQISFLKLIPMFITINFFYGVFGLWLTSLLKRGGQLSLIWIRVINPLVMFGGYFYNWRTVYDFSPTAATIMLINPLLYAMEGMRSAILGGRDTLPYLLSLVILWIFSLFFGWQAVRKLKKRMDCVS